VSEKERIIEKSSYLRDLKGSFACAHSIDNQGKSFIISIECECVLCSSLALTHSQHYSTLSDLKEEERETIVCF
jgi:hypothetical protein